MCGICGFTWEDERLVLRMMDRIRHRGPDGEGRCVSDGVSLGHARLAIIDLSEKGRQPMRYARGGREVFITYNGEVYNFQELRPELERLGYVFSSSSDTEVILASYLAWGPACVERFNGMWAFCIHDPAGHRLFLSRDRFGKKPLYYRTDAGRFAFASELKALLEIKDVSRGPRGLDKEAIDLYLSLGFIPSPHSIYTDIRKLGAGESMIYDLRTKRARISRYYHPPAYAPERDEQKLIAQGRALLADAVRLRLIADVPVGAFLSGGLDSSSVVGEMAEFVDLRKLHTFSMGFREPGRYDETAYMRIVTDRFRTRHHHAYFTRQEFERLLPRIFDTYDEPFGDYSMFPTFAVSALARRHVTVALSGDGGDEIFGGYLMHQLGAQMGLLRKAPAPLRRAALAALRLAPGKSPLAKTEQLREALRLSFLLPEEFLGRGLEHAVYRPAAYKRWAAAGLRDALRLAGGNFTEAMILFDRQHRTLGDNFLAKVDRASMACALEVRSPFLDYRFAELAARIPAEWKANARKRKVLMRKIIKGLVPEEIVGRDKQGFEPPLDRWIDDYADELAVDLEILHSQHVLDDQWYRFYRCVALPGSEILYQIFKVRLFLLARWWWRWHEESGIYGASS